MNKWFLVVGAIAIIGAFTAVAGATTVQAQEPELSIEGQLVNGTPMGSSVSGATVTLHFESLNDHLHRETTTNDLGRFRFDGVVYDPTVVYGVSTTFNNALYGSDLDLSAGSPPPVSLTVYDTTDDSEVLHATNTSVVYAWADQESQTVAALEVVNIVNTSDRAYMPGPDPMDLLRFGLPPGAGNLSVDAGFRGADIIQVDRGFALIASIPPGEHEVTFTYVFPYDGANIYLDKSFNYGAESFRALAPYGVLKLSSDQLGEPGSVQIGEREYQLLEVTDLPRGTHISLLLDELPESSFGQRLGDSFSALRLEYVAPVMLGLIMAALVAFAMWKRSRSDAPVLATGSSEDSVIAQERLAIRHMLGDLEQSFKAGEVTEDEYRRRRRLLNQQFASLPRA